MMERLTERCGDFVRLVGENTKYAADEVVVEGSILPRAIVRLAAYEDTGLTPEEITDIIEMFHSYRHICAGLEPQQVEVITQAKKDGRLVVVPCKIGDVVWTNFAMSGWYYRDKDKPYAAKVVFAGLNPSSEMGGGFINVVYEKNDYMTQFAFSEIGKTVFLTREEAEEALKRKGTK